MTTLMTEEQRLLNEITILRDELARERTAHDQTRRALEVERQNVEGVIAQRDTFERQLVAIREGVSNALTRGLSERVTASSREASRQTVFRRVGEDESL